MSSLFGITMSPAMQFVASLGFVIVLIFVTLILARNFGMLPGSTARIGKSKINRLSISEVMSIDGRRKLVLVRRDGVEHLLLLGGTQDVVIEAAIAAQIKDKRLTAKDIGISEDELKISSPAPTALNDEGYKITSWSVPATPGAAPQIRLTQKAPSLSAEQTAEAQQELRTSIEEPSDTRMPISQIVEKARDAAIQAVSKAHAQGVEALRYIAPVQAGDATLRADEPNLDHLAKMIAEPAQQEIITPEAMTETADILPAFELQLEDQNQAEILVESEALPLAEVALAVTNDSDIEAQQQGVEVPAEASDVVAPSVDAVPEAASPKMKSPKLAQISIKSSDSTKKHIDKITAMNAAMEDQIRALVKMPSLKSIPEPTQLQVPAPEQVANANDTGVEIEVTLPAEAQDDFTVVSTMTIEPSAPAEAHAQLTALDEVAQNIADIHHGYQGVDTASSQPAPADEIPASNVIDLAAEKNRKSPLELAFFSVFGEPKAPIAKKDEAEPLSSPHEAASYMDILDAATPKMKPKAKKPAKQNERDGIEQHPTYAQQSDKLVQDQLSESQFDELEMELAKLLQAPNGRA